LSATRDFPPIRVNVFFSESAGTYWASSPDLSALAACGKTRAEVERDAVGAIQMLFDLAGVKARPELHFSAVHLE
jgi:predicted RNase H-like HicB family nuclease